MRVLSRLLAVIVGLALAAGGVILIVEIIAGLIDGSSWLVDRALLDQTLSGLSWSDPGVLWTSVALVAAGLILLIIELKPRRPNSLPLEGAMPDRAARVDRRSLQARLAAAATDDEDVAAAHVKVGKRRAMANVNLFAGADPDPVRGRLRVRLREELERVGAMEPSVIRVMTRESKVRAR